MATGTVEKQAALRFIAPKTEPIRKRIVGLLSGCKGKGLTAKEISAALSVKVSTVTGRIDELWDAGTIHGVSSKGAETRYVLTYPLDVEMVKASRRKEKFHVWLSKGRTRYGDVISEDVWNEIFRVSTVEFI